MSTNIEFHIAGAGDKEAVFAMMHSYYQEDGYLFNEKAAIAAFNELIANPKLGVCFCIKTDDSVAGYIVLTNGFSFEYKGKDAFVDELYVFPEYRGKGFGKAAIRFATNWCSKNGIRALHLEVEKQKSSAYKMYNDAGFKDNDRYLMTKAID